MDCGQSEALATIRCQTGLPLCLWKRNVPHLSFNFVNELGIKLIRSGIWKDKGTLWKYWRNLFRPILSISFSPQNQHLKYRLSVIPEEVCFGHHSCFFNWTIARSAATNGIERQHHGRTPTLHSLLAQPLRPVGPVLAVVNVSKEMQKHEGLSMLSQTSSLFPIESVKWDTLSPTYPYRFNGPGYLYCVCCQHFIRLVSFSNEKVCCSDCTKVLANGLNPSSQRKDKRWTRPWRFIDHVKKGCIS